MRHNKKGNHLGRTSSHRKAMLANMAVSLIKYKRINTTLAKAKALRTYVEPIITKSKDDTTHSRRTVFAYLKDKHAVTELFRDVAVKVADRPGGYTRILKTGTRLGDNAEMCFIELVDYNANYVSESKPAKTQAKRTRRGKKTGVDEPVAKPKTEKLHDTPVAEGVEKSPVAEEVQVADETVEVESVDDVKDEESTEEETKEEEK
jgi:large subunit ribosomal protein L17